MVRPNLEVAPPAPLAGGVEEDGWLIVGAVDMEINGIRRRIKAISEEGVPWGRLWRGFLEDTPLCLAMTGVGHKKARRTVTSLLAARRFQGILSVGFAGGLQDGYEIGDLVIPGKIKTIPPLPCKSFCPEEELFQKACRTALGHGWPFHTDLMVTTDRVISTGKEKASLGETHQAGSVEMESSALAELAEKAGIPFLAVRAVSDGVAFDLPDSLRILGWWQKRQIGRILRHTVGQPAQIVSLIRLWRHAQRASVRLTQFLGVLIPKLRECETGGG